MENLEELEYAKLLIVKGVIVLLMMKNTDRANSVRNSIAETTNIVTCLTMYIFREKRPNVPKQVCRCV